MIRRHGKKATPPCPCGWLGHPSARCACSPDRIARYRARISGPLLDRIDLHVEVASLGEEELHAQSPGEGSAGVRARVGAARSRQAARQGHPNALLAVAGIERHCAPGPAAARLLRAASARLSLSARAFHRVLKVARTIADLEGAQQLAASHAAEALQYRMPLAGVGPSPLQ